MKVLITLSKPCQTTIIAWKNTSDFVNTNLYLLGYIQTSVTL